MNQLVSRLSSLVLSMLEARVTRSKSDLPKDTDRDQVGGEWFNQLVQAATDGFPRSI